MDLVINGIKFFKEKTGVWCRIIDDCRITILQVLPGDGQRNYIVHLEGCRDATLMTHDELVSFIS